MPRNSRPLPRRQVLSSLAWGGLAGLAGCGPRETKPAPAAKPAASSAPPLEGHALTPVEVDPALEIRTLTGLRPYRPSGFVVRREDSGGKILIHNYGHGGSGFTLSWGCAHLAVQLAGGVAGKACAVIGGGVMGLSTARLLLRQGARVSLHTEALPPATTSNIAGAQWWPVTGFDPPRRTGAFGAQFVEAANFSFRYFQDLVGPRWGVRWLPNYYLSAAEPANGWMGGPGGVLHGLQIGFRDFGPGEHIFPSRYARRFHSMFMEPPVYLETLLREITAAGAEIEIRKFATAEEIRQLPQSLLFNCTGLGAKALYGDEELTPIKGQLSLLLPQPAVNYNIITDTFYMFPRSTGILLGGSYERGNWDLSPSAEVRARILNYHQNLFTGMRRQQAAAGPPPS